MILTGTHLFAFGFGQVLYYQKPDGVALLCTIIGCVLVPCGWMLRSSLGNIGIAWLPCNDWWPSILLVKIGFAAFLVAFLGGIKNGQIGTLLPFTIFALAVFFLWHKDWLLILGTMTTISAFFFGQVITGNGDPFSQVVFASLVLLTVILWQYCKFFSTMDRDISETLAIMGTRRKERQNIKNAMVWRRALENFNAGAAPYITAQYDPHLAEVTRILGILIKKSRDAKRAGKFSEILEGISRDITVLERQLTGQIHQIAGAQHGLENYIEAAEVKRILQDMRLRLTDQHQGLRRTRAKED